VVERAADRDGALPRGSVTVLTQLPGSVGAECDRAAVQGLEAATRSQHQEASVTTDQRLDRAAWQPLHTRILLALGIGWAMDSFEVQILGSVIGAARQGLVQVGGLDGHHVDDLVQVAIRGGLGAGLHAWSGT